VNIEDEKDPNGHSYELKNIMGNMARPNKKTAFIPDHAFAYE